MNHNFPDYRAEMDRLDQAEIFRSTDLDETRVFASKLIAEHRLKASSAKVGAFIAHTGSRHVGLMQMKFGTALVVDPGQVDDFLLVHALVSGRSRLLQPGAETLLNKQSAGVTSPGSPFRILWEQGCEQTIVRISRERLEQVGRAVIGPKYQRPIIFEAKMTLEGSVGNAWRELVSYAWRSMLRPHTAGSQMIQRQVEELIVTHLLVNHAHSYSNALEHARTSETITPRCVRLAERFIEDNLSEPLTLSEIAESAQVTVRTLLRSYKNFRNETPMDSVRQKRLEQVHLSLQRSDSGSVSQVAYSWGFGHLGRFAQLYRKRYGELPRDTRRIGGTLGHEISSSSSK